MTLATRLAATCLATVAAAAPAAAPAVASPSNGLVGAANMVNDAAAGHMTGTAMTRNDANGDAGMFCAVYITNGVVAPGACP
ncbi:MAG TPA: hypothetical protein VFT42_04810 [Solirubrobacteraceae bacterium]|nr:hypothetical protein [Solirubrobacteraceae bacterium]